MSVRAEYMAAEYVNVSYENEIELAENVSIDEPENRDVLVLAADDAVVITGTKDQLLRIARQIIHAVEGQ